MLLLKRARELYYNTRSLPLMRCPASLGQFGVDKNTSFPSTMNLGTNRICANPFCRRTFHSLILLHKPTIIVKEHFFLYSKLLWYIKRSQACFAVHLDEKMTYFKFSPFLSELSFYSVHWKGVLSIEDKANLVE